jgi:hypothetical protein
MYHPRAHGKQALCRSGLSPATVSPARAWEAGNNGTLPKELISITRARMGSRFKCDETSHYKKYLTELNV